MKFTSFATVAIFFALVVANSATNNVDDAVQVESTCSGQWCYNIYSGVSKACCSGSTCNNGGGMIWYCT